MGVICKTCKRNLSPEMYYKLQSNSSILLKSCKKCKIRQVQRRQNSAKRGDKTWANHKLYKLKDRAKNLGLDFDLDREFIEWLYTGNKKCTYCHSIRSATFDRRDNRLGYLKSNLAVACLSCNVLKSSSLDLLMKKCLF